MSPTDESPNVVITGQQPGFMGSPLYTLYKIATTIVIAEQRSEKGHPTIPVFWAGDDDDDLVEAMAPAAWDPLRTCLFSGKIPPGYSGPRVLSELGTQDFSTPASSWLRLIADKITSHTGASDLASLYEQALVEKWTLSKLFCSCVSLIFSGTRLMIVNGNDEKLHRIAQPFYERVLPRLSVLQDLALSHAGTAINERSIKNPLFKFEKGQRLRLGVQPRNWEPSLRPGVLLRSLIQDWLFRPVAVVVGPGEKAYLEQLEPLYQEMGIHRAPLVPRLFAWLSPESTSPEKLCGVLDLDSNRRQECQRWANTMQSEIQNRIQMILQQEGNLPLAKANMIASKKARRMTRNMPDFFETINHRFRQDSLENCPSWLMPEGQRQERRLATFNAFAFWGKPMVKSVIQAAASHLQLGQVNNWQEFMITVPTPEDMIGKDSLDEWKNT